MKKILPVILCVILLMALVVPASAEGTVKLTLKASKTEAYRGDSIDFSIVASGGGTCQSYGYRMNIDQSVFTLVSHNITDNNSTTVSQFSADKGLAIGYTNPSVPSGTVCRFTLRVREDAPLNKSVKLSGNVSAKLDGADVSASGSGVTVKIACKHSYGDWNKLDNEKHQRICSVCENPEKGDHVWNDGVVTKEATCKESGSKEYTCTKCGAKKTQELPVTDGHQYSSVKYMDEANHQSVCTVCLKDIVSEHVWETKQVHKKATCKEEGSATYQCTGCKKEKTETIPKSTKHTYTHGCDKDCNVCGLTRETEHKFKKTWSANNQNHYHSCANCGEKTDIAAHVPGAAPTETNPQKCKICSYVLQPALSHTHTYSQTITMDEDAHWYDCSGCEEKKDYKAHMFDNGCDAQCDVCGFTRQTKHVNAQDWKITAEGHSNYCSVCGVIGETFAHTPGAAATETDAQLCSACGYELAPALGHSFSSEWVQETQTHYHVCQCGEKSEEDHHQWEVEENFTQTTYTCTVCQYQHTVDADIAWIWVLGGLVLVGLAATVIMIIVSRKRRYN